MPSAGSPLRTCTDQGVEGADVGFDERGMHPGVPLREGLEVSPASLRVMLERGEAWVLDCREQAEWDAARIEGSTLIPLGEIEHRLDEIETEARVVTVCHHGVRSLKAALMLRAHGIEAVSLAGGIDLWSRSIDPGVPRYERR